MTVEAFISLLDGVKQARRGWMAKCPAHPDKSPSLSICEGEDGRIVLHDFAGCKPSEICVALGLSLRDLFPDNRRSAQEIDRVRHEQEARRIRETGERQREGLVIDACREAELFVRSRRGIDILGWTEQTLHQELNALADAHAILNCEGLAGG
jgi:hypothetical protein